MNDIEKLSSLNSNVKLYSHQQRVVDNNKTSQIIAHGVGSGKTLTGIAKFEKMKDRGQAHKALVITPAGLRSNFGNDGVGKFTNSTYNIVGNKAEISKGIAKPLNPNSDYNIISYEGFKKNPAKILQETGADTVIFDEAHRMRNDVAQTTQAIRNVRPLYKNQISLTGSIVNNKPEDLYSLVDITTGGKHKLGATVNQFDNTFLKRKTGYTGSNINKAPIAGFNHKFKLRRELGKVIDYAGYEELKKSADMPGKKIQNIYVPLDKTQTKLYKGFLKGNRDVANIMKMKRWDSLSPSAVKKTYNSSMQARRMMNNVGSVLPGAPNTSPKTEKLLNDVQTHLNSDKRNQVALFSQLINGGMDTVESGLKKRNIPYGVFYGKGNKGSSEFERQNNIQNYNSGKNKVILISGAGGEGLSLKNTTMEGMLDPHYNPERMNQMEARGVRSGGLKDRKDRNVKINQYVSVMPKTLGIFPSKYKTPDQFIYGVANRKNTQNEMLRKLLRKNTRMQTIRQKFTNLFAKKSP